MKVVAVVPLKLNNERLQGKNTKRFDNGVPLLSYVLNTLRQVKGLDEIVIYCSDASISEFATDGVTYVKRSVSLDQSTTKINEVLQAFAADVPADIYVLVHATAPFLKATTIQTGLDAVLGGQNDSALTVQKLQEFIWKDSTPLNYDLNNIPRTQDLPPYFVETSGLYIYKKDWMVDHGRRIGDSPLLISVGKIEAVDINDPVDFDIANALANKM